MGLKDLFIKSDESSDDKPIEKVTVKDSTVKFPTSEKQDKINYQTPAPTQKHTSSFNFGFGESTPTPAPIIPIVNLNVEVTQEQINSAYSIYQNGFDSLNSEGYDFYEYFQMVIAGGIENAPIYPMAFAMGKSANKGLTKDALTTKADYYMGEINKVYDNFSTQGNNKKQEIISQKSQENQSLLNDVHLINEQMESLKVQLADRESKLRAIDSKYASNINDVDAKLTANSIAKDKIISEIQTVKNGIINNVN